MFKAQFASMDLRIRMSKQTSGHHRQPLDSRLHSDQFLPLVYEELRTLAEKKLLREKSNHTLQPTALVHEAYLRLVGDDATWENRAHFFGAAAEAMRRILIDHARSKQRHKRKHDQQVDFDLDSVQGALQHPDADLLELDEVLQKLEALDSLKAELVKLKFFAGLSIAEAARCLDISPRTGERYWAFSRAWMYQEMSCRDRNPEPVETGVATECTPRGSSKSLKGGGE